MQKLFLAFTFTIVAFLSFAQNEPFTMRIVNTDYQLKSAWELLYGPDDSLWVTESNQYKVSKINIANGKKTELLDLSQVASSFTTFPQGGLMGMALHPSLYNEWPNATKPWVYLAYVYRFNGCLKTADKKNDSACLFKTRIVRYQYNRAAKKLENPQIINQDLNGSSDHNSGRLAIGEIEGVSYLFYTIGDMGSGQFKNAKRKNRSQERDTLEGKVLRFNLEPTGNPALPASWIPADNPYKGADSKPTAVWSWGHRNAQGLAFGNNGILYSSEQQDWSDDEVNIIHKGGNYGWPLASGYYDGNYDGLHLAGIPVISEKQDSINLQLKAPIFTLYTEADPARLIGISNSLWPTVACSSIDVYEKPVIPGWSRSLLVPSLKAGLIQRLKLDASGTRVMEMTSISDMDKNGNIRYRDICISPDGLKIFASCDFSSQNNAYKGRILEYTYTGSVLAVEATPKSDPRPKEGDISLFPNPVQKQLNVRVHSGIQKPLHYTIHNLQGKMILQGKSIKNEYSVNVESLPSGIYVLKMYNTFDILFFTGKFMVN